jgi:ABC-type branched-subunit amino acid transport system permease subunit
MVAFGLGTGLTAFGGGIILSYSSVSPTSGAQYVVLMFTVVVLGGLGSVMGAIIGGVAVGIIQSLSTLVMPFRSRTWPCSSFSLRFSPSAHRACSEAHRDDPISYHYRGGGRARSLRARCSIRAAMSCAWFV